MERNATRRRRRRSRYHRERRQARKPLQSDLRAENWTRRRRLRQRSHSPRVKSGPHGERGALQTRPRSKIMTKNHKQLPPAGRMELDLLRRTTV